MINTSCLTVALKQLIRPATTRPHCTCNSNPASTAIISSCLGRFESSVPPPPSPMLSRQRHGAGSIGGLAGSRAAAGSLLSGPWACHFQGSRRAAAALAAARRESSEPPHHTQRPRRPQLRRGRFPNAVAKPQPQQPQQQQLTAAERQSPQQLSEALPQHQAAEPAAAAGSARSGGGSSNSSPVALLTASAGPAAGTGPRQLPADFLADLSDEQLEAVLCDAQHIRVIAGPGSGKTRVVTSRVANLVASGVPSEQLLVITFTRKAAGELCDRVSQLLGPAVARQLKPRTFHSVCVELLRKYEDKLPPQLRHFHVADEDDTEELVNRAVAQLGLTGSSSSSSSSQVNLLDAAIQATPAAQLVRSSRSRGSNSSSSSSSSNISSSSSSSNVSSSSKKSSSSSSSKEDKKKSRDMRQQISLLKNFSPTLHRSGPQQERMSGMELVQQLVRDGVPEFTRLADGGANTELIKLAAVYDRYMAGLAELGLMDFDDLLHGCLALIKSDPQVAAQLHSTWAHVLVDEGQDTNHAQFGLVRQFTGVNSSLFMVGDPCQAIYGFRGALSRLLCEDFERVYQQHSPATLFLSDNYRSRPSIVMAADLVKKYGGAARLLQDANCMRGSGPSGSKFLFQECSSLSAERKLCTNQLECWQRSGYRWGEMAVLCRTNWMAEQLYNKAVEQGIPSHLVTGLQLWQRPEVKSALALLRCVVHPVSAGDAIRRRLAGSGTIKVSSLDGLGGEALRKLQEHLYGSQSAGAANSAAGSSGRTSLGSCLLADCCPSELSAEQAGAVLSSWAEAAAAAETAGPAGTAEHQAALMGGLQQLAPVWQPPQGFISIRTAKQKAAVARLRGLVLLGRAAAELQQPAEVLQLLLKASGIWGVLEAAAAGSSDADLTGDDDSNSARSVEGSKQAKQAGHDFEQRTARKRLGSLRALLILASKASSASSNSSVSSSDEDAAGAAALSQEVQPQEEEQQAGLGLLQRFYDYCVLQGEDDKEDSEPTREVQFMSMHASKGKEFPCVVLPHVYDGMLPLLRSEDASSSPSGDELEQEKNLLFVGMTRAKDHLLITWPREKHLKDKRGEWHSEPVQVSRFLTQAVVAAKSRALAGVEHRSLDNSRDN